MKNPSLIGACRLVVDYGSGPYSLDRSAAIGWPGARPGLR